MAKGTSVQDEAKAKVESTAAVGDGNTGVPGIDQEKNGTMYLSCAELFLGHEGHFTNETFRGLLSCCSTDFKEAVKLLLMKSEKDDVVIVSDGRSELIRKEIRAILTATAGEEEFIELWVIYNL